MVLEGLKQDNDRDVCAASQSDRYDRLFPGDDRAFIQLTRDVI